MWLTGLLLMYKISDRALTEDHLPKGGTTYSNLDLNINYQSRKWPTGLPTCTLAEARSQEKVFPDKTPTKIEILELEL